MISTLFLHIPNDYNLQIPGIIFCLPIPAKTAIHWKWVGERGAEGQIIALWNILY